MTRLLLSESMTVYMLPAQKQVTSIALSATSISSTGERQGPPGMILNAPSFASLNSSTVQVGVVNKTPNLKPVTQCFLLPTRGLSILSTN